MTAVLVVCTGNVCRSPIAEGLMRRATEHRAVGAPIMVTSAGTAGWEGSPAMPEAVDAAAAARADAEANEHQDEDIADPLGLPLDGYRTIASELDDWIGRLVPALFDPVPATLASGEH